MCAGVHACVQREWMLMSHAHCVTLNASTMIGILTPLLPIVHFTSVAFSCQFGSWTLAVLHASDKMPSSCCTSLQPSLSLSAPSAGEAPHHDCKLFLPLSLFSSFPKCQLHRMFETIRETPRIVDIPMPIAKVLSSLHCVQSRRGCVGRAFCAHHVSLIVHSCIL